MTRIINDFDNYTLAIERENLKTTITKYKNNGDEVGSITMTLAEWQFLTKTMTII